MSRILVTGGAGYIGSFIVKSLLRRGHLPIVFDNMEEGHVRAVANVQTVCGDLADKEKIHQTLRDSQIDAVIHMAAYCLVGESQRFPLKYFHNNVANGLNLLEAMIQAGLKKLVFSSSAAVYGEPSSIPIHEESPTHPTNVYGETKLYYERILKRCENAYGLRYVALRYFNAAGANKEGTMGEDHRQETHLIPRVLKVARDQTESIEVFGTTYPTPDGTCIRDYVHVEDLAEAHVFALDGLEQGLESTEYNVGNGRGYSVMEVIDTARRITGKPVSWVPVSRRPGDPAVLVASADRIRRDLGWNAQIPELSQIIQTAWNWHASHPNGYGDAS